MQECASVAAPPASMATAGEPVSSDELVYLQPDAWLKANPVHKWTIDQVRRREREAKDASLAEHSPSERAARSTRVKI